MKRISIRIDDACPRMDQGRFYDMVATIEKCGIKGLIGIVPDCNDDKLNQSEEDSLFWEKMRELQQRGWVLAQHGYKHVYDICGKNLVAKRKESEFAGHTYSEQREKILNGKSILEANGIETDVFFAPAHTYDRNTLKALRSLGFRYVSDGCTRSCYKWYGLKLVPCRIQGLPKKRDHGIITIVTHPCVMSAKDYDEFVRYINNNKESMVNYSTLQQANVGMSWIKIAEERIFVVFYRHVRPWLFPALVRVRSKLFHLLKG